MNRYNVCFENNGKKINLLVEAVSRNNAKDKAIEIAREKHAIPKPVVFTMQRLKDNK